MDNDYRIRKRPKLIQVGDFINDVMGEIQDNCSFDDGTDTILTIEREWESILGKKLSSLSKPVSITKGVIIVSVKSPQWRMEMQFMKQQIVQKIVRKLPNIEVRDIIFR